MLAINTEASLKCRRDHLSYIFTGKEGLQDTHCKHAAEVASFPCDSEVLIVAKVEKNEVTAAPTVAPTAAPTAAPTGTPAPTAHVHFDCAKFKTECVDTGKADAYADCAATLAVNTHTTVECRRTHLGLITAGDAGLQDTHCGHAAEVATGPCASESLVMAFNWESGFSDPDMQHATVKGNSSIGFYWDGMHNIYELPDKAAYDACDFSKATVNTEAVKNGKATVDFPALGNRFFACQVGSHCKSGQKVMVHVTEAGAAPKGPGTHDHGTDHGDDHHDHDDTASAVSTTVGVGIFAIVATLF